MTFDRPHPRQGLPLEVRVVEIDAVRRRREEADAASEELAIADLEDRGFRVLRLAGDRFVLEAGPFDSMPEVAEHLVEHGWQWHDTDPERAI